MKIHISRDGETFGPFTIADFYEMVGNGNVTSDDHCWVEFSEWMSLHDVANVFSWAAPRAIPPPLPQRGALGLSSGPPPLPATSSGFATPLTGIAAFNAHQNFHIRQEMEEANQHLEQIEEDVSDLNEEFESDMGDDFDF
jgi:hypothetical protein